MNKVKAMTAKTKGRNWNHFFFFPNLARLRKNDSADNMIPTIAIPARKDSISP